MPPMVGPLQWYVATKGEHLKINPMISNTSFSEFVQLECTPYIVRGLNWVSGMQSETVGSKDWATLDVVKLTVQSPYRPFGKPQTVSDNRKGGLLTKFAVCKYSSFTL